MLYSDDVGEAMFLGEMLIGIDLDGEEDGEEPGEDSKCMVVRVLVVRVNIGMCIAYGVGRYCIYTLAGTFGTTRLQCVFVVFSSV